jgi:hypothetical protein
VLHLAGEVALAVTVEAAKQRVAAVNLRHLGAKAVKDPRKFDGDVAATHNGNAAREFREVKRFIARHCVLDTRY